MQTQTLKGMQDIQNRLIDLKLPQETRLRLADTYEPTTAWRLLSRYISRYPQDLRVHAQRVLLSTDEALSSFLPGAIQDLIIALSGKGKPFFQSLVEQVKPALSESEQQNLMDAFDTESQQQCWKKGSVLANGICNDKPLVIFEGIESETGFNSALEEAQAYIEYGELEEAREILEGELLNQPGAEDIEAELLYLYQSMREPEHIKIMTMNLQTLGAELSPQWQQCLEDAQNW